MQISSQKYEDAKLRRKGLGYDDNALYLSTMLGEMPCGRGEVQKWPQTKKGLKGFLEAFRRDRWFGFLEKDVEVPRELWPMFEEMPRIFCNRSVPS